MFGPLKLFLVACFLPLITAIENNTRGVLKKQFQCGDNTAVPYAWLCDGEEDCKAGEDEAPALCSRKNSCEINQFKCANGLCISKSWLCDNEKDCSDGSDEHEENCLREPCPEDQFMCATFPKQCIPKSWQCNGHSDCPDNSDEINCNKTCGINQFTCSNGNCINETLACNSYDDCGDNSDELKCAPKTCDPTSEFTCSNGECISKQWLCDGSFDCTDKSDELNCNQTFNNYNCNFTAEECVKDPNCKSQSWLCNGIHDCISGVDESPVLCNSHFECPHNHFQCNDGSCIPQHLKCSGTPDCPDASDELNCIPTHCDSNTHFDCGNNICIPLENLCSQQQNCPNFGEKEQKKYCASSKECEHMARVTKKGFYCDCEPGYRLVNGKNCVDINECEIPGTCSQICINTIGSYTCDCEPGYLKDGRDPTKCHAPNPPHLLIASTKEIRNVSIDYEPTKLININKKLINANAVDYALKENLIFWTDLALKAIIKKSLINNEETQIINEVSAEGLAVDWVHKNIYWTDRLKGTLEMCDFHGEKRVVLIRNLLLPRALALDPINGLLFWTSWGEHPKIERAGLDGSDRQNIVQARIGWPNGISLEPKNKRIFWTDAKEHKLFSSNYFGTERRVIPIASFYLKHPYSIATFEDVVYWGDWDTATIYKTNKYSGGRVDSVTPMESLVNPMSMKIYHSYIQPETANPCDELKCSFVCLQKPDEKKTHYCICKDNEKLSEDGRTCLPAADFDITTTTGKIQDTTRFMEDSPSTTTIKSTTKNSKSVDEEENGEEVKTWIWISLGSAACVSLFVLCSLCLYRCATKLKNKDKVTMDFKVPSNNRKIGDSTSFIPRNMSGTIKSIEIEALEPLNFSKDADVV